jgi:hypothetical protein
VDVSVAFGLPGTWVESVNGRPTSKRSVRDTETKELGMSKVQSPSWASTSQKRMHRNVLAIVLANEIRACSAAFA